MCGLGFLLLAGTMLSEANRNSVSSFDNYTLAYRDAHQAKKPMLVILNPDAKSSEHPVTLADVAKTKHRRELLQNFVVVLVDTNTPHGKTMHDLFGSAKLPRVVVIDRDQRWQLFQTSRQLQGEDWNRILETFQTGDADASLNLDVEEWGPT